MVSFLHFSPMHRHGSESPTMGLVLRILSPVLTWSLSVSKNHFWISNKKERLCKEIISDKNSDE